MRFIRHIQIFSLHVSNEQLTLLTVSGWCFWWINACCHWLQDSPFLIPIPLLFTFPIYPGKSLWNSDYRLSSEKMSRQFEYYSIVRASSLQMTLIIQMVSFLLVTVVWCPPNIQIWKPEISGRFPVTFSFVKNRILRWKLATKQIFLQSFWFMRRSLLSNNLTVTAVCKCVWRWAVFKIVRLSNFVVTVFPNDPLFRLFRDHNSCRCAVWRT